MKMGPYIRTIGGGFVLISLALGYVHHPYWQLFTAFVGLNSGCLEVSLDGAWKDVAFGGGRLATNVAPNRLRSVESFL